MIYNLAPLDYALLGERHQLTLRAVDSSDTSLSVVVTVNITVLDVNEAPTSVSFNNGTA